MSITSKVINNYILLLYMFSLIANSENYVTFLENYVTLFEIYNCIFDFKINSN